MTGPSATVVEAAYRVTTPMFCGGAAPETVAELRLPSFKGALRFWWRALAWRRLGGNLAAVREEEAKLFGSSDRGQSRVAMSMRPPRALQIKKGDVLKESGGDRTVGDGVRYLGYGLMEAFASSRKGTRTGELTRPCLRAPFDFRVRMALRTPADVDSLRHALVALGTLGGMGARSRKGFGSLSLRSLHVDGASDWDPPSSRDELGRRIKALYGNSATAAPSSLPPITAISDHSRHLVATGAGADAIVLLDRLGREQVLYRSWGRHGKVLGEVTSERNFKEDHDLMKRQPWQRDTHPERIAFGLPHNYGGRNGQVGPAAPGLDRRASPLFIHIHECGREAVAVISFLPAEFLPTGKRRISVGREKTVPLVADRKLYRPIHNFLDRLLDPNKCKEPIVANEAPR